MNAIGHICIRRAAKNGVNGKDACTLECNIAAFPVRCSDGAITHVDGWNLSFVFRIGSITQSSYTLSVVTETGESPDEYCGITWHAYANNTFSLSTVSNEGTHTVPEMLRFTATKTINGETFTASCSVPFIFVEQGEQGIQGCIARTTEWHEGIQYRNDEQLTSGTRYLDIVVISNGNTFSAWKCLQTHTGSQANKPSSSADTAYWQRFNVLAPVYTPLIMAQNAIMKFMQGNQLLIMKANGTDVACALSGSSVPLWLGASTPENAPFSVDENGNLKANTGDFKGKTWQGFVPVAPTEDGNLVLTTQYQNITIGGTSSNSSYDIQLPKATQNMVGFRFCVWFDHRFTRSVLYSYLLAASYPDKIVDFGSPTGSYGQLTEHSNVGYQTYKSGYIEIVLISYDGTLNKGIWLITSKTNDSYIMFDQ